MALPDTGARAGDLLAMRLIVPAVSVLIDDAREAAWATLRPLKPDALSGEESRAALVNALDAAIAQLQELRNLMQELAKRGGCTAGGPWKCLMDPDDAVPRVLPQRSRTTSSPDARGPDEVDPRQQLRPARARLAVELGTRRPARAGQLHLARPRPAAPPTCQRPSGGGRSRGPSSSAKAGRRTSPRPSSSSSTTTS